MAVQSRTRLPVDARRAQLLQVGTELFSTRPYDEVRIDDIAKRAGVSRGLLYHYFPTKRHLYIAGVEAAVEEIFALTEPDAALPPLQRLSASIDAYLAYAEEHAQAILTTHAAGIGYDSEVRAIIEQGQDRQTRRIVEEVAGTEDAGPILYEAVRSWFGQLVTATVGWIERGTLERAALRDMLAKSLVGLILTARELDPDLDRVLPSPPVE